MTITYQRISNVLFLDENGNARIGDDETAVIYFERLRMRGKAQGLTDDATVPGSTSRRQRGEDRVW